MAETTLASAIVAPEPVQLEEPSESRSVKRRLSNDSEEEQDSKRQRISPGKSSPSAAEVPRDDAEDAKEAAPEQPKVDAQEAPRKRPNVADEKQRSKRLFGALLGNLNQPGDRTSKRRQEIESRRKAELQRQDDERVEDKVRRQEELAEWRKKEQAKFDEENMHLRHKNMLHAANFLQTTAEPKLYYRPWDLRADEEERIDAQIKEVQTQIDQELGDFEQRRERSGEVVDGTSAQHSASPKREELPMHDHATQEQPKIEMQEEATKTSDDEEEAVQATAKSSEDIQPTEVPDPDPDPTNANTNNTVPNEATDGEAMDKDPEPEDVDQKDVDANVEADDDGVIY